MDKITEFADYFRKIPAAFLVAIVSVLALILFLPDDVAATLAVDGFRRSYRVFLGPALLLTTAFLIARLFTFLMRGYTQRQNMKAQQEYLHSLTPQEKGYLVAFIHGQQNTVHVGLDDGIMSGLESKRIVYRAAHVGDLLNGFAFNLQPWARRYLEANHQLLSGHIGRPMTPRERTRANW